MTKRIFVLVLDNIFIQGTMSTWSMDLSECLLQYTDTNTNTGNSNLPNFSQ